MTPMFRRTVTAAVMFFALLAPQAAQAVPDGDDLLADAIDNLIRVIEPARGGQVRTLQAKARVVKAAGLPSQAEGAVAELAFQAPDKIRITTTFGGESYTVGRDGQELWLHQPSRKFGIHAKPGLVRFAADPGSIDHTVLPPFEFPMSRIELKLALLLVKADYVQEDEVNGERCHVLLVRAEPKAVALFNLPAGASAKLWLRQADLMPMRAAVTDGGGMSAEAEMTEIVWSDPWPADKWKLKPNEGDKVETVALSHAANFLNIAPAIADQKIPTLGPATGKRELIGVSGKGRLEMVDGTRVLYLRGSPEEMGRQHGELLRTEIRDVAHKILYGVGVGSSIVKGNWFFGEIEGAQARLLPHMDQRYLREMDAIADAAGMHRQESRLANFFPELFHCTGFALTGTATKDGHLYHGRVLDYLRGVGLEQNAVVMVYQPDDGRHAWVNVGYAGFVGSVTAMNAKGIAIGEMGGGGYGAWDGKPMAHLVREVMERASTLEEAVEIMRKGPRTCEYYYVISDGKTKKAVAIAATPDKFETLDPGQAHEKLPHAVKDAVLLSAGDRYETLVQRVRERHGQFEAHTALELMTRPVCMTSNIQSVLFRPDTLDFWVANADSRNVASHTRYTHYNLQKLLTNGRPQVGF